MSPSRKAPPSAVVGLDIGSDSIKVAEAKFLRDGITITALGIARTPEGLIDNEVIVEPKALGAAVKSLLAECGIKTKQCVSSVAGQSRVVVRVIEVPKMDKAELAETMKWEVEKQVPFSPTQVVMDFAPLERPSADPDAQNMEVLLAVAQDELINSHVEMLQAAGLKPVAIDIEPLAASRALIETSQNGARDEVVAIVNIGNNNTDLGIFEQGILTFPSPPLGIAGISFTREISEALGQTLEQAETTKKEYASVDLSWFGGTHAPAAAHAAPPPAAEPAAEPTAFSTSFEPEPAEAAPAGAPKFDLDSVGSEPAEPSADEGAQEPSEGTGPTFDLGGGEPDETKIDLGESEPPAASAGPVFDLDDDEPPTAEPEPAAAPSFDLTDAESGPEPAPALDLQLAAAPQPGGGMEAQVFQAISDVLVDLANELRRLVEYYGNRYSKYPERIILCGGTAKMPHLDEYLSQELGVPVEVGDPLKSLNVKVTSLSDRYIKEISPLFSVCVGLAIRDMIG